MRRWRAAVVVAALAAAVYPEFRRYGAERLLWRMHAASDLLAGGGTPGAPAPGDVAEWIARSAETAAAAIPGDGRPWTIAGESRFVLRDPAGAEADMLRAFRTGERADVDFEIGRACILRHDFPCGDRAILRAAWISPSILDPLPEAGRAVYERRIAALESDLAAGRLAAPPAPPEPR